MLRALRSAYGSYTLLKIERLLRRFGMDAPFQYATEPEPLRISARVRRPNVTLDLEGVHRERPRTMMNSRSGLAANVSTRINEILDLMADDRNLHMVKEKLSRAIAAFEKFKGAQFDYWSEVKDANSVTECQEYWSRHANHFDVFRHRVNDWIITVGHRLLAAGLQDDSRVKPNDSVSCVGLQMHSGTSKHSNRGSRACSRGSRTSSFEAARMKEMARLAELKAEEVMLKKRQVLEEKKFRLSQEEARLKLEAEIAKSAATGQAFSYMPSSSSDVLQHKPRSEPDLKTMKVEAPSVVRHLSFRENRENPADIASVRRPQDSSQRGKSEPVVNNMPDNFHQEAKALQRQQTALQAHQNRIVELLAVNQNKVKLPQPRVPTFDEDPVEYCTFIRAFESLIVSHPKQSREALLPRTIHSRRR